MPQARRPIVFMSNETVRLIKMNVKEGKLTRRGKVRVFKVFKNCWELLWLIQERCFSSTIHFRFLLPPSSALSCDPSS